MNKYFYLIILSLSFYITSCSENSNPVKKEDENITPVSNCSIQGLEIQFSDTCSYDFITTFLSNYDSVTVMETFLGSTFYLYADSGDYNYWLKYFENDSTIQNIIGYNSSDSLILKIKLTGKKSTEEERQRFLQIKNLEIIKIEEYPNLVYIDVPENKESEWVSFFMQYSFISHVYIIGVCTNS